ncbi:vicilin-like seed storage protein At2g18540 [Maniola jurtina]|uniref:vicilin-like seed storage protein At2g18540 n=1 Tax=Maniola jurtina TaxID=191418 RepID=UPI001E688005|nr:vicilin-like seed storage protein At2g18540 [Maniola jurtina]
MPIAMSTDEWARLSRWSADHREEPEAARRREAVQHINQMSQLMTKSWPNSLENVNKRNEELRRARLAAAEQANSLFYARYVKQKQAEQARLMYNARDSFFKNKDAPKLLLGAVIETVIQKEREEQVKFNKELKKQAEEKKKQDEEQIIQNAKEWHALMELRRKRRFEVNKKHQKEILDQAHEVSERNRKEYEEELNQQMVDNIKAQEQMESLREFEQEYSKNEKEHILADMQRAKQEADKRRQEQEARDKMDDRLIEVLQRSRARIERRRRQTEKQIQKEKQEVLEKISQRLESGDAERDAKEQQILEKAVKEKEAAVEARRQAELLKKEKSKQERIETRKQFLQQEKQRLHELNVMHQWEVMNRFKNDELYEEFQKRMREEKKRKILEYREDIIKQWREREEREAAERAETRRFYGELAEKKLRDADNKLLTHGAMLLQEARQNGRPDYALRQTLDRYCKLHRLYPMPDLPSSLQEHFKRYVPRDLTQPDPEYVYPAPPEPSADQQMEEKKRDGLQEPVPGPIKPPAAPSKEPEDYKRAGPANGLQRRNALHDIFLPPITVRPCETAQCDCELKNK